MPRLHPEEETLRDQVQGILREVLEGPGLRPEVKDRLQCLISDHPEHPERALFEHLHTLRDGSEPASLVTV